MHVKYPSMINHYQNKDINYFKVNFPEQINATDWVVSEKIDGSNVSFVCQCDQPMKAFSRNQEITNSNFMKCGDVITEMIGNLQPLQTYVNKTGVAITIFGELFGPKIQKRIYYGPEKRILFFDMMVNKWMISHYNFEKAFNELHLEKYLVPKLCICANLDLALQTSEIFQSTIYEKEKENLAEGIVIKPYRDTIFSSNGARLCIKKKNPKFAENMRKPKQEKKEFSEKVNDLRQKYNEKVNDNRIKSIFSKAEEISSFKDIGKYLGLVKTDILEELIIDGFNKSDYEKDEYKFITGGNDKEIVELLKAYL